MDEAKELIDLYGDKAETVVRDVSNGISADARVALTAKLYEKYVKEGENEKAVDIAMWQANNSLEHGRASNAAKIWKAITSSGEDNIVLAIEKEKKKQIEGVIDNVREELIKSKEQIEAEIKRLVEEKIQTEVESRIERSKLLTKDKKKEISNFFDLPLILIFRSR